MPIHDYVCSNCGHTMEVMHSVHGHGPSNCPKCGGAMKRAFAAPAVHFKGSGWARKDRSSSAKPSRAESKEAGASSGEGAESSTKDAGTTSGAGSSTTDTGTASGAESSASGTASGPTSKDPD